MTENMKPLKPDALYTKTDPRALKFKTTDDLTPLKSIIGQDRAVEAVRFAVGMPNDGYNLFALGPEGTGKQSLIEGVLKEKAARQPLPSDWCYVNNFDDPYKPRALELPPGKGRPLRADMKRLVADLKVAIPAAFEGDDYRHQKEAIEEDLKNRNEAVLTKLGDDAEKSGCALIRTPVGFAIAPAADGEVLSPKEFEALSKKQQKRRAAAMESLQQDLEDIIHAIPKREKEMREKIRALNRKTTQFCVGHQIEELKNKWNDAPTVHEYLEAVSADMVDTSDDFMSQDQPGGGPLSMGAGKGREDERFNRYQVNVIVDNTTDAGAGAPAIYEDHPTQPNLIGRIEHMSQFGTLVTDFTMIKAGALHRAKGGYLVLDVRKVLTQPFAWETLMRTLRAGSIRIESPGESLGWIGTVTLQPEPIPLDVKVVLVGEPRLYYL
ncbi:MAG: AAA family ATPase, partial [Alphaproteobacteria bacterium]